MVSIVLVTYNRAPRLKLSIQDILNQTFKDFELIICDDCSTDSTEQVCREFQRSDDRIRYFRHDENLAMPANCNFGISKCRFDYVAILHDGDRFKPDLIEQWYTAIASHDSVGFVFNSIGETDEHDMLVNSFHEFDEGIVEKESLLKRTFFRRWRFDSPVYGQAMVKKVLLDERGNLKDKYGFYSDVDLWMDILHSHDAYYCSDTLITGPTKNVQPRLFQDNPIDHFMLMFHMHEIHRQKAFRNRPIARYRELGVLLAQSLFFLTYSLLLVVKNQSFRSFLEAGKILKSNFIFLITWTGILLAYPIIYVALRLVTAIKGNSVPVKASTVRKKLSKEPVTWLSWFTCSLVELVYELVSVQWP